MKKIVSSLILTFIFVCFSSPTVVCATEINNSNKEKINPVINNVDFDSYIKTLERKIKNNWNPPKNKQDLRAVAVFKMNKDGTISEIKILKTSYDENFDNAAIVAIYNSSPFRALPTKFKGDSITIQFTFDYHVKL